VDTETPGILSTVRIADDHLVPPDSMASMAPTLIERVAASHAAVLEKWSRNFALDLRRPQAVTRPS
jgi:hypothetical protein